MENEQTRRRLGWLGLIIGTAILAAGVAVVHFTELPELDDFGREQWAWVPRHWVWAYSGKIIAFTGSQIMIAGVVVGWLLFRPMTWARASVGAAIFSLQILLYFGVVPNEWLNLTQGELEWTSQSIWFTLPEVLTLNNEVSISFAAVKDSVSGIYNAVALGVLLVGMYQWQERRKRAADRPQPVSTYGRPIVKADR